MKICEFLSNKKRGIDGIEPENYEVSLKIYHVMNHDFKQTYQHVFWNWEHFLWLTVHSVTIGQWWVKDRHLSHWVERPFDPESYYVAAGWARVVRHGSKWSLVSEMESEIDIPMKNMILLNNRWLTTFQGLLNRDFLFELLNFLQISGFLTLPTQTTPTPKTEGWVLNAGEAAGGGTSKLGWGG